MATFFQIIIVLVLLAAMVMILLGIGQLGNQDAFENNDKTSHLREDVEETSDVISDSNIFNSLLNKREVLKKKEVPIPNNKKDHRNSI